MVGGRVIADYVALPVSQDRATAVEPVPVSTLRDGIPSASDDSDPYWEYDESECENCGGEGFTYGCSWDWQCDTYDAGEGTCLCERPCDWCNPLGLTAEQAAGRKYLGQSRDYGGFAGMTAAEMEGR